MKKVFGRRKILSLVAASLLVVAMASCSDDKPLGPNEYDGVGIGCGGGGISAAARLA